MLLCKNSKRLLTCLFTVGVVIYVCNGMAEFKFKEFLWFVIETRNELIEERLKGKGKNEIICKD